jgi:hypothetical protein
MSVPHSSGVRGNSPNGPPSMLSQLASTGSVLTRMLPLLIVLLFSPAALHPQSPVAELRDNEYAYAFQYPSNWRVKKAPKTGETLRVLIESPAGNAVAVVVGQLRDTIGQDEFDRNPNREAIGNAMLDFTIEQVYRKASRDMGAGNMVVQDKRVSSWPEGLGLYVSTLHTVNNAPSVAISGLSMIPWKKPYMVTFTVTLVATEKSRAEIPTLDRINQSFHLLGARPGQ